MQLRTEAFHILSLIKSQMAAHALAPDGAGLETNRPSMTQADAIRVPDYASLSGCATPSTEGSPQGPETFLIIKLAEQAVTFLALLNEAHCSGGGEGLVWISPVGRSSIEEALRLPENGICVRVHIVWPPAVGAGQDRECVKSIPFISACNSTRNGCGVPGPVLLAKGGSATAAPQGEVKAESMVVLMRIKQVEFQVHNLTGAKALGRHGDVIESAVLPSGRAMIPITVW